MRDESLFSAEEWLRYTRHIQLPQVGAEGQSRLKHSRVVIVGAGGLGSPVAYYLAAAGLGHITLIDADTVDITNLQRQIIFSVEHVGQPKVDCASARLLALNPHIQVEAIQQHFSLENGRGLVEQADIVLDCTDNFATRYAINDVCLLTKTPWLFASIHQFAGQCALFTPESACFRCLFPDMPQQTEDCNSAGVLGILPGLLGTLQANEALKYLLGLPCALQNALLLVDAIDLTFKTIQLAKHQGCLCSQSQSDITLTPTAGDHCNSESQMVAISADIASQRVANGHACLLDVRSLGERQAFHKGGMHIPLAQLPQQLNVLDSSKQVICYCQTGKRSLQAVEILERQGIDSVSIAGGLLAWLKAEA